MNRTERLKSAFEALKSKGVFHTQLEAAEIMGCSRQNMSSALKGEERVLTENFVKRFSIAFPDINADWILTGEGDMIVNDKNDERVDDESYELVPVVHIDSVGGLYSENDILTPEYYERYIPVAGARKGDVAIYQSGNSMAPAIPSGAILIIREVQDWQEYIGYGDVFVLLLRDQRRITKEVHRYKPDPQNYYWCISYNPDVADEELPKKLVRGVWKVVKVLIDKGW